MSAITTAMTLLSALTGQQVGNLPPERNRFQPDSWLPGLPPAIMDTLGNGFGLTQQYARARRLQGRVMWIDGTANLDRMNSEDKIRAIVSELADVGFNTIVYDVKPIVGYTLYPSKLTQKLTEWRDQKMEAKFDPVPPLLAACKQKGISLFLSMNAFCEGHQLFQRGPGYDKPELQTVLYEANPVVYWIGENDETYPVSLEGNLLPGEQGESLSLVHGLSNLDSPSSDMVTVFLDAGGKVLARPTSHEVEAYRLGEKTWPFQINREAITVLVGRKAGARFLKESAPVGWTLRLKSQANLLPIGVRPKRQIPLMMNPHLEENQARALSFVREVLGRYAVDGIMFDDRLRFGGLDTDFSESTHRLFESYVKKPVRWPEDIYEVTYDWNLRKGLRPGKYWNAWLSWRAATLQNWVVRARRAVNQARPGTLFGVYQGSWYGDYPNYGSNWAAQELSAGFSFLTRTYSKTGFAQQLDFLMTGCYYKTGTIFEALASGTSAGQTVEAAGQLTNAATRDQCWAYAGIMLQDYYGNPEGLRNALRAATASTQGVMVFDLSHRFSEFAPVLKQAFRGMAEAPTRHPEVLIQARAARASLDKMGAKSPPVFIQGGAAGAGF